MVCYSKNPIKAFIIISLFSLVSVGGYAQSLSTGGSLQPYNQNQEKSASTVSSATSSAPQAQVVKTKTHRTFVNYQFSPRAVFGMMFGWCDKWGGYASFRTSIATKSNVTGQKEFLFGISGWCIDAGPMVRCTDWLYINLGIGYGTYNSNASTKFSQIDTKGFDAELGINFVMRAFTINLGYNTIISKDIAKISPLSNLYVGIGFAI